MEIAELLRSVEVFQSLSPEAARRLAESVEERHYGAETKILRRGEAGDSMFVIVAGEVEIPIQDDGGRRLFLAHLGPRQVFGEMALLTGERRSADVIAVKDCHCLVLPRVAVESLMRERPEIARFLTAILSERLASTGGIRQVGKYRLAGEIGQGRMSRVYEAVHPTLDRPVAIKMLSHELVYQPHFADRFRNEARIMASLRHPNIVEVYDTEEACATFFIVMERIPGTVLDRAIERAGRLGFETSRDILRQLASALHAAHTHGVIHRDVKPSNVAFGYDGQVKLMDFGLALSHEIAAEEGDDGPVGVGTPCYMAPEQIQGEPVDGRADIYSLGILAYEMLTGAPPFTGNMYRVLHQHLHEEVPLLTETVADAPEDLVELVRRATAKSRRDRFASCEEVSRLLGSAGHGGSLSSLGVRTITLVWDPAHGSAAEDLVEEVRRRAAALPGVILR